ncbi:MAG: hypothetical protein Q7S13_07035, partial [Candidatus Omnitrophota bacterium]|nr:hypothetical protein [Candidatus Omnitrophota bacterium]
AIELDPNAPALYVTAMMHYLSLKSYKAAKEAGIKGYELFKKENNQENMNQIKDILFKELPLSYKADLYFILK